MTSKADQIATDLEQLDDLRTLQRRVSSALSFAYAAELVGERPALDRVALQLDESVEEARRVLRRLEEIRAAAGAEQGAANRRHRAMITVEGEGPVATVRIRCDACAGGEFWIARAHLRTLARVLPEVCEQIGLSLADGITEHVYTADLATKENARKAEELYLDFVRRRKEQEG